MAAVPVPVSQAEPITMRSWGKKVLYPWKSGQPGGINFQVNFLRAWDDKGFCFVL